MPAIAWAVVILSLSGEGGSSSTTETILRRIFPHLGPDAFFYINYSLRKAAHIVGYGILGFLNFRALGYRRGLLAVLIALPIALADEMHQSTTPLRTGSLADIGFDVCGAALFVAVAAAMGRKSRPRP